MIIQKPAILDDGLYFKPLIEKVESNDLIKGFKSSLELTKELASSISSQNESFAYAPGKWTIKQVFQHLVDCEFVYNYRALSIARGEKSRLMGFDENEYAFKDKSAQKSLRNIVEELGAVRQSTVKLFSSFDESQLDLWGNANGLEVSPRIIGWFCLGHNLHHVQVIKTKYLNHF